VQPFHGGAALAVICAFLYAEEAGLPIPFAPGEAVLIAAGLVIASGTVPYWAVAPAVYGAALAGALTGFAWARAVGPDRLNRLAFRVGASAGFERAAQRLRTADLAHITLSRLVPGLRIYTTLVAGAVHLNVRTFGLGIQPALAIWVATFLLLGIFVGPPATRVLGTAEALVVRAVVVAVILIGCYLVLRKVPRRAGTARPVQDRSQLWRLAAAAVLDILIVVSAMAVLAFMTGLEGAEPPGVASAALVVGSVCLLYMLVARRSLGFTAGEAVFRVHYP
jgi:membrane-associated protein